MEELLTIAKGFPWNKAASVVLIIIGAVVLWKIFNKFYYSFYLSRSGDKEKKIAKTTHEIAGLLLIIVALLTALQVCGINVTSLVAGLGIASAIVGLALQDILKDLITGLHIITDGFFAVGDGVEFEGSEGIVISVNLKTTKIKLISDGSVYSICNRNIEQIRKLSDILELELPLGYGENHIELKKALGKIAKKIAQADNVEKCEFLGTLRFDESAIIYRFNIHCKPADRERVKMAALDVVQTVLGEEEISIPYNQLDVHFDK